MCKYKLKSLEIICFFIALFPRVWIVMQTIPLRTIGDEMGHIAGASLFAGYDWTNSIVHTQYYGQGFYSLFFWVFWLTDDPIIIYRVILVICCLLQSLVVFIIFYICRNYAKIDNMWAIALIAVSSSYMIVTRVDIIYNESILNLLTWVLFLALCKIIYAETRKEFILWSLILCLLMGWGITIHLRIAVCLIALFIVIFVYYIIMKKEYRFLSLMAAISFFSLIGYIFTKYIQNLIWRPDGNIEQLGNTKVKLNLDSLFSDFSSVIARINIMIGQMNTITIFSCSFFILSIVALVMYLWRFREDKDDKFYSLIFICGGLFLLSIGGTCFAQALSWGEGVYNGLINDITEKSYYSYKGFTYVRYFGPYVSPFIAIGSILLWRREIDLRICLKTNMCIVFLFVLYWLNNIQHYISRNTIANEVFIFFSQKASGEKLVESSYLFGIFWVLISAMCMILFLKKNMISSYVVLSFVLIWNYMYTAYNYDIPAQELNYEKINMSYEIIQDLSDMTQEIYYYYYAPTNLTHGTYATNYLLLQFWLPRKEIIPLEEEFELEESAIVVTNGSDFKELISEGSYLFAILDDNEYLFVFGEYIDTYEKYLEKRDIEHTMCIVD